MTSDKLSRAAVWLATGAAVSVSFSNAVCQILLGAALLAVLAAHRRLRFPRIWIPLAIFVLGTVIALLLSPDPHAGLPQIKKFYVYLMLPVLYTALSGWAQVRNIFLAWGAVSTASAAWSFVQFFHKRSVALAAGQDFYTTYVARRVTGFMSHWMTFSAEQMIAGLLLAALVIFGIMRRRWLGVAGLSLIGASILLAWTRSVWIGTALGACYLIAVWRPKALLAVPVVALVLFAAAPESMRQRVTSLYTPHGTTDSNEHRRVTFFTGLEMVKAHPVFGLGPEMPGRQFMQYLPSWIHTPLPEGFYGHLHNVYLQYAAERGIPTLLALLCVIGMALWDFWRAARAGVVVLHGAIAAILGLLAEGFFEHNLGDSEVLTMFLVVLASGYVLVRERCVSSS